MTLALELAISNVEEAIRGSGHQLEADLRMIVAAARGKMQTQTLEQSYMTHFIPVYFKDGMDKQQIADASMRCRAAAKVLATAATFDS